MLDLILKRESLSLHLETSNERANNKELAWKLLEVQSQWDRLLFRTKKDFHHGHFTWTVPACRTKRKNVSLSIPPSRSQAIRRTEDDQYDCLRHREACTLSRRQTHSFLAVRSETVSSQLPLTYTLRNCEDRRKKRPSISFNFSNLTILNTFWKALELAHKKYCGFQRSRGNQFDNFDGFGYVREIWWIQVSVCMAKPPRVALKPVDPMGTHFLSFHMLVLAISNRNWGPKTTHVRLQKEPGSGLNFYEGGSHY